MKFLITGSIRSARGPRLILTFTLILLLLFIASHGMRDVLQTGFSPDEIRASIFSGGGPGKTRSLIIVLEDLHIDLFLYSVLLLFLGSLVNECGLSRRLKFTALAVLFSSTLLYALARPAAFYVEPFAYLVFAAGWLFHITVVSLILYLLYFLWSREA